MLFLKQLLAGREFAQTNDAAIQMVNFVYLVGDRDTGECLVVDPAWDVGGIVECAAGEGMRVVGAVATHGHADHVGGRLYGTVIEGAAQLCELARCKAWCNELEADRLLASGVREADLIRVRDGDTIRVGNVELRALHTPGHTPGAQCLLVEGKLLTGDTLFVNECGRVDLPGSDPDRMFASLSRLKALPGETVVCPGHDYGPTPTSTLAEQRLTNPAFQPSSADEFVRWALS